MSDQQRTDGVSKRTVVLVLLAVVIVGYVAAGVALFMIGFAALTERYKAVGIGVALIGLMVFWVVCLTPLKLEWEAIKDDYGAKDWSALISHAPELWVWTMPLAPVAGTALALWWPNDPQQEEEEKARIRAMYSTNDDIIDRVGFQLKDDGYQTRVGYARPGC